VQNIISIYFASHPCDTTPFRDKRTLSMINFDKKMEEDRRRRGQESRITFFEDQAWVKYDGREETLIDSNGSSLLLVIIILSFSSEHVLKIRRRVSHTRDTGYWYPLFPPREVKEPLFDSSSREKKGRRRYFARHQLQVMIHFLSMILLHKKGRSCDEGKVCSWWDGGKKWRREGTSELFVSKKRERESELLKKRDEKQSVH
jgi:hypothetical protein